MANLTIADLPRITPTALRDMLLDPKTAQTVAVIDVRDSDYIGGHINPSRNIPTPTHDTALPELVRTLADKQTVVFHCMLSQQRGPSAALKYARERLRLRRGSGSDRGEGQEGQKVVVLQGGFDAWVQAGFGPDKRITEGFVKDLWDGYSD